MNTLKRTIMAIVKHALIMGFIGVNTAHAMPNFYPIADEQLGEMTAAAQQMSFIPILRFLEQDGRDGLNETTAQTPPHLMRVNRSISESELRSNNRFNTFTDNLVANNVVNSLTFGMNSVVLIGQLEISREGVLIHVENTHIPVLEMDMNFNDFDSITLENLIKTDQ